MQSSTARSGTDISGGITPAFIRKRAERVRQRLPDSPGAWAKTVNHIVKNATPRRQSKLQALNSTKSSTINNTLEINKFGSPKNEFGRIKKQLAFSEHADELTYNKNLTWYKKSVSQREEVYWQPLEDITLQLLPGRGILMKFNVDEIR